MEAPSERTRPGSSEPGKPLSLVLGHQPPLPRTGAHALALVLTQGRDTPSSDVRTVVCHVLGTWPFHWCLGVLVPGQL